MAGGTPLLPMFRCKLRRELACKVWEGYTGSKGESGSATAGAADTAEGAVGLVLLFGVDPLDGELPPGLMGPAPGAQPVRNSVSTDPAPAPASAVTD